jgi:hypothetical protein
MALAYDDMILSHVLSPLQDVKDNPARVGQPPLLTEVVPVEIVEYTTQQKRRLVGHWLSTKDRGNDWALDQLMELNVNKILANFEAGDDAENGRLVANALLALCDQIERDDEYWQKEAR